jgi:hypothetical protein
MLLTMLFLENVIDFPWYGLLVDISNLSVMADYSLGHVTSLQLRRASFVLP